MYKRTSNLAIYYIPKWKEENMTVETRIYVFLK